ncbi:uncharacterized protein [Setaria viridis]
MAIESKVHRWFRHTRPLQNFSPRASPSTACSKSATAPPQKCCRATGHLDNPLPPAAPPPATSRRCLLRRPCTRCLLRHPTNPPALHPLRCLLWRPSNPPTLHPLRCLLRRPSNSLCCLLRCAASCPPTWREEEMSWGRPRSPAWVAAAQAWAAPVVSQEVGVAASSGSKRSTTRSARLQELLLQIVARPLPNDILEWLQPESWNPMWSATR